MKRRRILLLMGSSIAIYLLLLGIDKTNNPALVTLAQQPVTLRISAAISLSDALKEIKELYQQSNPNVRITYNFGASGVLQQQIQQGAPVDVFFSAANKQMDALQQANLIIAETRRNLLTNRLVLITPRDGLALTSFRQLTGSDVQRIAIGEPKSVPAGQYAQELLKNLEIWQQVQPKIVFGNNVRQVLTFVASGNVDAGIVYKTDAAISSQIQVRATAPTNLHSPIVYPVAVIKDSSHADEASNFVQFLAIAPAIDIFQKYGFGIIS